jgi:hypothetical protein
MFSDFASVARSDLSDAPRSVPICSTGILFRRSTIWVRFAVISSIGVGVVGNSGIGPSHATCAGFALGKKSSDTKSEPVIRLPLLSCARIPAATSLSTVARFSSGDACACVKRSGSISIVTGIRNCFAAGSNSMRTSVTCPIGMPRNSTGAPTLSPRTD